MSISLTVNSYNILLIIEVISSSFKFAQSTITTGALYLSSISFAKLSVSCALGMLVFKTITNGFPCSFNSFTAFIENYPTNLNQNIMLNKAQIIQNDPSILKTWDEYWGDRQNKLVFIGKDMDKQAIIAAIDECVDKSFKL